MYLSDWKHAIDNEYKTMLNAKWKKEGGEPKWDELLELLEKKKKDFILSDSMDSFDHRRIKFKELDTQMNITLSSKSAVASIERVVKDYNSIGGDNFESLVRSTCPMLSWSPKNSKLNLHDMSKEYREEVQPAISEAA